MRPRPSPPATGSMRSSRLAGRTLRGEFAFPAAAWYHLAGMEQKQKDIATSTHSKRASRLDPAHLRPGLGGHGSRRLFRLRAAAPPGGRGGLPLPGQDDGPGPTDGALARRNPRLSGRPLCWTIRASALASTRQAGRRCLAWACWPALPWLVNPLLSALALYLVYRLGQTLYDERVGPAGGRSGLALAPLSGAERLLPVAPGQPGVAAALQPVVRVDGAGPEPMVRPWCRAGAGHGLSDPLADGRGLCRALCPLQPGSGRPAASSPTGPTTCWWPWAGERCAALLPVYQWAVTGDPWLNPYVLWWPYDRIGFGPGIGAMPGGHSLYYAWINLKQDLSRAATDLLGWPALSWLPLVLGLALRPRRAARLGAAGALCLPGHRLSLLLDRLAGASVGTALLL